MAPASTRSMLGGGVGGGGGGGGRGVSCSIGCVVTGYVGGVDSEERTLGSHLHDALSGDLSDP